MSNLIIKLAKGETATDADLEYELFEICARVHSSCDNDCPVFLLNGSSIPDTVKDFETNRGCDCFKSGKSMLTFIRAKVSEAEK